MTAPKLRKHELRLIRQEAAPAPTPVTLHRFQSSGQALLPADAPEPPAPLRYPDGPRAALERALARGDAVAARALLEGWSGDAPEGRSLRARVLVLEGDLVGARALLGDDVMARDGSPGADASLALAEVCWAEGDAARAHELAEQARDNHPIGFAEHLALARALLSLGQVPDAARILARIAANDPEHALSRYHLAEIVAAQGDLSRAGTLYEMALASAPGFVPAAISFAELLMAARHHGEAMQVLNHASEHASDTISLRVVQLRLLLDVGEGDLALQLAESLRAALPDHGEILALWARALALVGREGEAQGALESAQGHSSGADAAAIARALARLHLAASPPRTPQARAELERALRETPDDEALILEVAELQARAGDREQAEQTLLQLLELRAADLNRVYSGAWLAYHLDMHEPARRLGEAVLECVRGTPAEGQVREFLEHSLALPRGA